MKQRVMVIVASVACLMGGWWALSTGRIGHGGHRHHTMGPYTLYTGTRRALKVSLEYPGKWMLQEEQGKMEFYQGVRMLGPRNADDTYAAYVSVRGFPLRAFGGSYEDLHALVEHYKIHAPRDSRIVSESPRKVAGAAGRDLTFSFTIPPLHHKGIKALAIPVKERKVFVEHSPYLYELTYSADSREYDRYAEAFEHLLKTLRLK